MIKRNYTKMLLAATAGMSILVSACRDDAEVANNNTTRAADNFELTRRIVFYNGITDRYMLEVIGKCSIGNGTTGKSIYAICKQPDGKIVKHQLGISDNVTWFMEQIGGAEISVDRYRVVWKPQTIIPDIELRLNWSSNPVPAQR